MDSQINEDKLMLFNLRINWKKFDDQTKESIRSVIEKTLSLTQRRSFICNDIWFDVFEFFGPAKLGLLIAGLSKRFNALVDSHFSMTLVPHLTFDYAMILRAEDGTGAVLKVRHKGSNLRDEMEEVPMDSIPFRKSIKKIHEIHICYTDRSVFNFLRGIKQAFDLRTQFEVCAVIEQSWDIIIKELWPLVPMFLGCISVSWKGIPKNPQNPRCAWNDFPVSLLDCAELRFISCTHQLMPYAVVDDVFHQTNVALFNWLHLPRADSRPKFYFDWCSELDANESIKQLKEKFINDKSPANYCFVMPKDKYRLEDESLNSHQIFSIKNEKTQELLQIKQFWCNRWMLIRNQISWDWSGFVMKIFNDDVSSYYKDRFIFALNDEQYDVPE